MTGTGMVYNQQEVKLSSRYRSKHNNMYSTRYPISIVKKLTTGIRHNTELPPQ